MKFNCRQTVIFLDTHPGFDTDNEAPAVGRFKLLEIANMDQTPIALEFLDNRTYGHKRAKPVWLKENRSGGDRRQTTL